MYLFALLLALACTFALYIWAVVRAVGIFRRSLGKARIAKKLAATALAIAVVASPFLIFKATELYLVLRRVPEPLQASWIEYRIEDQQGIGLPGDNEAGFVVYRLSEKSAAWARSKGDRLGEFLPGGAAQWRPTPVDDKREEDRWHSHDPPRKMGPHSPMIQEYIDRYVMINIPDGAAREADHAIRTPGSFYTYGSGGSVTIVDPIKEKVYFAYAG